MAVLDTLGHWPEETWFQKRLRLVKIAGVERIDEAQGLLDLMNYINNEKVTAVIDTKGDIWQKKAKK